MVENDKSSWIGSLGRRVTEAVVVALIAFAGVLGGAWFTLLTKDHELKVRLVEIGISILRADPKADPKDDVTPARGWAIEVIEKNSETYFSPEDKALLLHTPIQIIPPYESTYTPGYDSRYTPGRNPR